MPLMESQTFTFSHDMLQYRLRERLSEGRHFVASLSQQDVIQCGAACITDIVGQFIISSPILRVDSIFSDDEIIEALDESLERRTGYTHHSILIPIEQDFEWLEEVRNQNNTVDDNPLAFLQKDYARISIRLTVYHDDPPGELKRKLDHRMGLVKSYANEVVKQIDDFNMELGTALMDDLGQRRKALIKADDELERIGLPRLYNPEHKDKLIKVQTLMQNLGVEMRSSNKQLQETSSQDTRTFIVHGHDNGLRMELKNYLQNILGLPEPIILHEQPGAGKTIIEKFERDAANANLVFVLMTPDDEVANEHDTDKKKRSARPNVIFEMGYFLGKLGREDGGVILLHSGPTSLPSDISGIEYIDVTGGIVSAGELIRKELKNLGLIS